MIGLGLGLGLGHERALRERERRVRGRRPRDGSASRPTGPGSAYSDDSPAAAPGSRRSAAEFMQ